MELLVRISDSPDEWGLVELQGVIETKNNIPYDNLRIGDLHYTAGSNNASLVIGHHLLTGTVVTLDPPLAVLKKRLVSEESVTEYVVVAFIKKKLLFRNRPKPLVVSTTSK